MINYFIAFGSYSWYMCYLLLFHDLLLDEYHLLSCYLLTPSMIHLTLIIITIMGMITGHYALPTWFTW